MTSFNLPRICAASKCLSGQEGAVKRNTAGDVIITDKPWG